MFFITYLLVFGIFTSNGSSLDKYFKSKDFYVCVYYLGIVTSNSITPVRFINFQMPRESEISIENTLDIMNVSKFASEVSMIIMQ
jgi:hypothetical protein